MLELRYAGLQRLTIAVCVGLHLSSLSAVFLGERRYLFVFKDAGTHLLLGNELSQILNLILVFHLLILLASNLPYFLVKRVGDIPQGVIQHCLLIDLVVILSLSLLLVVFLHLHQLLIGDFDLFQLLH